MATQKKSVARRGVELTREKIGAAALDLIDAHGLEAFSARRLAQALKCEAMSLYHHVENMDDVLDLVVDQVLRKLPSPGDGDPRRQLLDLARKFLTLAEEHPRAFPLVPTRRWRTPNAVRAASSSVLLFQAMGLAPREALRRARILGAYLGGAGLALSAWGSNAAPAPLVAEALGQAAALTGDAVRADLDAGLKRLLAMPVPT